MAGRVFTPKAAPPVKAKKVGGATKVPQVNDRREFVLGSRSPYIYAPKIQPGPSSTRNYGKGAQDPAAQSDFPGSKANISGFGGM